MNKTELESKLHTAKLPGIFVLCYIALFFFGLATIAGILAIAHRGRLDAADIVVLAFILAVDSVAVFGIIKSRSKIKALPTGAGARCAKCMKRIDDNEVVCPYCGEETPRYAEQMEELYRRGMFLSHPMERKVFEQFKGFIDSHKKIK